MTSLKTGLVALLSVVGIAAGCVGAMPSSSSKTVSPMTPSELAANPEAFDGKHVEVRGYVVVGPESRNIFDSKEASADRNGVCLGLAGSNAMFSQFHRRYERLSGTFRKKICGPNDVCLYWCGESGIELDPGSTP